MRILAIERPLEGAGEADFTPEIGRAEALRAWHLHQTGVIRELYFQADRAAAVLVLECQDAAAARADRRAGGQLRRRMASGQWRARRRRLSRTGARRPRLDGRESD